MQTDLTFITNEKNRRFLDRFNVLIKNTRFFDLLVGYFYTSGFHALYKSLENTEGIRILIGINTSRATYDLIQKSKATTGWAPSSLRLRIEIVIAHKSQHKKYRIMSHY